MSARHRKKSTTPQQSKRRNKPLTNKHVKIQQSKPPSFKTSTPPPTTTKRTVLSKELSKEITKDKTPVVERNDNGDVIHGITYTGMNKFEYWVKYDDTKPIRYTDNMGRSWGARYNSLGNISDYWDYTGYEEVYKYYANELVICTTSTGMKIKKHVKRIEGKPITRDVFVKTDVDCII